MTVLLFQPLSSLSPSVHVMHLLVYMYFYRSCWYVINLRITLATDAYGPVADNAGGIAEMVSDVHPDPEDPDYLSEEVRDNTDALDAMELPLQLVKVLQLAVLSLPLLV